MSPPMSHTSVILSYDPRASAADRSGAEAPGSDRRVRQARAHLAADRQRKQGTCRSKSRRTSEDRCGEMPAGAASVSARPDSVEVETVKPASISRCLHGPGDASIHEALTWYRAFCASLPAREGVLSPLDLFDAIVIGSGFGGAVAACRLTQAGQRVCLLERGRRFTSTPVEAHEEPYSDFPKLPASDRVLPDMARLIWGDDRGLWQMRNLGNVKAFVAAGYGGGSLIYANVHLRPPEEAFEQWPVGTRGEDLEPYYRLAAYMLDVRPITEARFHPLPKTDQFAKAADALGRGQEFFYPPLAVRLNGDGPNAFGQEQSTCRACGECLTGCRYRAKNSLDLNYLAEAERQTKDGVPLLSARTGAEALRIRAPEPPESGDLTYEVEYRDHVEGGGITSVRAPSVFVCAGALGSTELLLRSTKHGCLPRLANLSKLGRGYFPNADALGVVFDARLDSDSNGPGASRRELYPTVGPTITASLVYDARRLDDRHSAGAHPWFLLQDGGFPLAVRRHMGLMRAPVPLRRNCCLPARHRDGRFQVPAADPPSDASTACALYRAIDQRLHAEARLPLDARPFYSLADALLRILRDDWLSEYLPKGLETAVRQLRSQLTARTDGELLAIVTVLQNRLANDLAKRLTRVLLLGGECAPLSRLLARMGRLIMRWLLPYERVAAFSRNTIEDRYLLNDRDPTAFARQTATELCAFDDPGDINSKHSMVLLAMGIDGFRSSLALDESDELRSDLEVPIGAPVYRTQEQLMHDVATALRGDLRVSPLWAFARDPVTVHSQGGCAMGSAQDGSVTNPYGGVHAYEGLHVLDAAAFPGSVGANPSATILALAERNIEHFIRQRLGISNWTAPENGKAAEFWEQWGPMLENPARRTFIRPPEVWSRPPVAEPIGITFTEAMYGHHSQREGPPKQASDYDAADIKGREKRQRFEVKLTATARDAAELAADRKRHRMSICGSLVLTWPDEGMPHPVEVPVAGHLDLFTGHRRMVYRLRGCLPGSGRPVALSGCKWLRDGPGPDAIRDTTTLYTRLCVGTSTTYGVMHVALDELLRHQLPSFEVTGTDDPARVAWALGAFAAFFFGDLQKVYLPGLDKMIDLSRELGIR